MPEHIQTVSSNPRTGDDFYRLGNSCHLKGDFEGARLAYRQAVELNPRDADSWNNLGKTFKELNRLDEAIAAYDCALALRPELAVAHCNRAIALLSEGRFEEGWREYEWRWKLFTPRGFAQPLWDGAPLQGGTLFINAEQGLGDAIQFVRHVALAREKVSRIILECQAPLKSLFEFSRCADTVIAVGETPPPFDCYLPLMSLPRVFGTTLDSIPCATPYLRAPPTEVPLPTTPGYFKVGLAWAGNSGREGDAARSLRLEELSPLLQIRPVTFFNLQVPIPPCDEAFLRACANVVDLSPQLLDFAHTAAIIAQLDLVISVDTAVAHLAGALGKPTWTLLQHSPDWRWFPECPDSPWYPTMRLFRQSARADWRSAVQLAAEELNSISTAPK